MTDLISRADAVEAVRKELVCDGRHEIHDKTCRFIADVLLSALPSADAVQGEWIYDHHNDEHTCSVCGRKALCDDHVGIDWQMEVLSDYCPSCGARMKGGAE